MKVRNLLLLLAFCCLSLAVQAQFVSTSAHPKREFRAAWIQAVNGQFRGIPTDRLKQILINQLNSLQGAGINAIIFQVRPEADALYASVRTVEPFPNRCAGQSPGTLLGPYAVYD